MKYFKYAMGEIAREEYLRVHSAHPDQAPDTPGQSGTEMKMPGGRVGTKT